MTKALNSIKARLRKAGIKLVKKEDEGYLEFNGKVIPVPFPTKYEYVCKQQFGIEI